MEIVHPGIEQPTDILVDSLAAISALGKYNNRVETRMEIKCKENYYSLLDSKIVWYSFLHSWPLWYSRHEKAVRLAIEGATNYQRDPPLTLR